MKKYILFTFFCLCIVPPVLAIDYQNWMRPLDDNLFLSRLSIPGAHDAATSSCSSSGMTGSAHTQTYTIAQQLERGVRFFDLRPAVAQVADRCPRHAAQFRECIHTHVAYRQHILDRHWNPSIYIISVFRYNVNRLLRVLGAEPLTSIGRV